MKIAGRSRVRKQKNLEIEPIPKRPPGYFANVYSKAEIQKDNRLAKTSVVHVPKDLE